MRSFDLDLPQHQLRSANSSISAADHLKDDPTILIWQEWYDAFRHHSGLCRRQQRLEARLLEELAVFRVELRSSESSEAFTPTALGEIDRYLPRNDLAVARAEAKAHLREIRRKWEEADAALGYSVARAEKQKAAEIADDFAKVLWRRPANSLFSVIAKLHALIAIEAPSERNQETPWPELRLILLDLALLSDRAGERKRTQQSLSDIQVNECNGLGANLHWKCIHIYGHKSVCNDGQCLRS